MLSIVFSCNSVKRQQNGKPGSPCSLLLCREALEVFSWHLIAHWRSCSPLESTSKTGAGFTRCQKAHVEAKGSLNLVTVSRFSSLHKKSIQVWNGEIQQSAADLLKWKCTLQKEGSAGELREWATQRGSVWVEVLSAMGKGRVCRWPGEGGPWHSSLSPSFPNGGLVINLEGGVASKLPCRSTRPPTLAETRFYFSQLFLTPGNREGAATKQASSHKSHPQCSNLERGKRGRAPKLCSLCYIPCLTLTLRSKHLGRVRGLWERRAWG